MIFDSLSSKALERSLDAAWLKMRTTSDNIANYETPGYKAKKVTFEQVLRDVDDSGAKSATFRTRITTDETTSNRMDGNNVSMEKEQLELWRTQAQYAYLVDKVSGKYSNLRQIFSKLG